MFHQNRTKTFEELTFAVSGSKRCPQGIRHRNPIGKMPGANCGLFPNRRYASMRAKSTL